MNTDARPAPEGSLTQSGKSAGAREKAIRSDQLEAGSCHKNHEDPAAIGAVIACGH